MIKISILILALVVVVVVFASSIELSSAAHSPNGRSPRSAGHASHHSAMHNHLSRKVFDRACAASKDTIDEIVACLTGNDGLMKSVKLDTAKICYKESFDQEFDAKDVVKHKDLICNNRDKFEAMTTCIYKKTGEMTDVKEMEKLTETLVDVGLCIINALDG